MKATVFWDAMHVGLVWYYRFLPKVLSVIVGTVFGTTQYHIRQNCNLTALSDEQCCNSKGNLCLKQMMSNILEFHLDKRLTWHKHIFSKRKHLGITLTKLYWLLGRRSKLNLSNKLLIYKVAIKPIWTHGIQLWGAASTSSIKILERFQSKALRLIPDAPWYVLNAIIRRDLQAPSVKEEICRLSA
jgi:hypothetical protein